MEKFKVGDRVVVIDTKETERTGNEGVIIDDDTSPAYPLLVRFENEDIYGETAEWFNHDHLEYDKSRIVINILNDL